MRWKRGSRLKLVDEGEASASVRAVFDEVRHCLGVSQVPILYRAYAATPQFLQLHWDVFRPVLETRRFFQLGARIAAEAYTRAQSYLDIPDLSLESGDTGTEGAQAPGSPELSHALDYFQYLDPLLLLIAAAQMQAFEGPVGQAGAIPEKWSPSPSFLAPRFLSLEGAPPGVQRIWDERGRILNLAFVPDEDRAVAVWPSLYRMCYSDLRKLVVSPLYANCQYRIDESAWGLANEFRCKWKSRFPACWKPA
jgi:hypothetical protein